MDAKSLTLPPDSIPPLDDWKQKSEPKGLIELSHETFLAEPNHEEWLRGLSKVSLAQSNFKRTFKKIFLTSNDVHQAAEPYPVCRRIW